MKILQFIILLLYIGAVPLKAQKIGYIHDKDGYTNLRLEKSEKSPIIGIILSGQEFKYYPDSSADWWKVEFKFRKGFMHKSRIKDFNKVRVGINQFFKDFYSTDKNNVELGEGHNEKLFLITRDYPLATLTTFCEQRKEIQDFLISEYESPIHDLIDLQLIFSRLINVNSQCLQTKKITEGLKIAAQKIGLKLMDTKFFIDNIPDLNRPDKYEGTSNKWFTSSIKEKPITFYMNHPQIDSYTKMFYQGQFGLMDNDLTFSILDSVLTENPETRPFYIYTFNSALRIADGALAESIGPVCKQFMEKFPCDFIRQKSNPHYSDNYNKWIDFAAFEYCFEENPTELIKETYDSLYNKCDVEDSEFDYIKNKLIDFIKKND